MVKDLKEEQQFHDNVYASNGIKDGKISQKLREPFYKLLSESIGKYEALVIDASRNYGSILELGGGKDALIKRLPYDADSQQFYIIDISAKAVELMNSECTYVNAFCGDATKSVFPDKHFDLIFGKWILHHLDMIAAINEIKRILKPNGIAIFIEPMSNPIINVYRKLTPKLRTSDEHPLNKKDLNLFSQNFCSIEYFGFHLLWFLAPLLIGGKAISKITSFERNLLSRFKFLIPYCWEVIICVKN